MASAGLQSWAQLEQQSESLVAGSGRDQFPAIQRGLAQLEELSRQLKVRTYQLDTAADSNAAARLLAQEGLDPDRLMRDVRGVELRTTYEDVFPTEGTTVEDYLEHVSESLMLSAIRESHRRTNEAFDSWMIDSTLSDWEAEKKRLAAGFGRSLGSLTSPAPVPPFRAASAAAAGPSPYRAGAAADRMAPADPSAARRAAYLDVVKSINKQRAAGAELPSVAGFAQAAADSGAPEGVATFWQAVASTAGGRKGVQRQLVAGAKKHLEELHVRYLLACIRSAEPQTAALGGAPGNLARVRAFLRATRTENIPLDFDAQGGGAAVDTTWQQVFFCLRSGFHKEAVEVAQGATGHSGAGSAELAAALGEWVASGGAGVSAATALRVSEDAGRVLRNPAAVARHFRLLVSAIVSGDAALGDKVHSESPSLFGTIEDLLWFKLCLVREPTDGGFGGGFGGGRFASSASPLGGLAPASPAPVFSTAEPYTISDLQRYLNKYPPEHYSKAGREPLLYATVLLLSLQFAAALRYLTRDAAAEAFQTEGVHLAVALTAEGALSGCGVEVGAALASEAATLVAGYGRALAHSRPREALEYLAVAASAAAGASPAPERAQAEAGAFASLVKELLREGNAVAEVLGDGPGVGGELARFLPAEAVRREVVAAAAADCEAAALYDVAAELHRRVGNAAAALSLVNRKLGDAITASVAGRAGGAEAVREAASRGRALADAARAQGDRREVEAFEQLLKVDALLAASRKGAHGEVLSLLRERELGFIPLEPFRVERCCVELQTLHPAVAARLPEVLLAAAHALSNAYQAASGRERLFSPGAAPPASAGGPGGASSETARRLHEQIGAVAAFAGSCRMRIPAFVYQQLTLLIAPLA